MEIVIYKVISLFIPIGAGFLLKRRNILKDDFAAQLSRMIYLIFLPLYIINSMNYEFSYQALLEGISLIIASIAIIALGFGIGFIFSKFTYRDHDSRSVVEFAVACSNFAFMGIPIIGALFGERGIFLASMHNIGYFIFSNSISIMLMTRDQFDNKKLIKNFINIPTIAVLIGFFIFLFNIKLPVVVTDTIAAFSACAPTLSMLLVGIILADCDFISMWKNWKLYIISLLRLLVIPLAVFAIMYFLPIDREITDVAVLIAAMPVAVQVVLFGEKFGKNSSLASQSVAMSTIFSLITIPFMAWLLAHIA